MVDQFADYLRAVRAGAKGGRSTGRGAPPTPPEVEVEAARVGRYRLRATHLDARLAAGSERAAAWAGLQDTAPRSALVELHARMENVSPSGWEAPELAQVWLRWAAYVVPRLDVAVFTIGAMPRDPGHAAALNGLAGQLLRVMGGRPRTYAEIEAAGFDMRQIRFVGPTGRFLIRWDASNVTVIPTEAQDEPPADAVEAARLELARRFLRWFGPSEPARFARWAGVPEADARTTWDGLSAELAVVSVGGRAAALLRADLPALVSAEAVTGVRLLAPDDPILFGRRDTYPAQRARLGHLDPDVVGRRLLNSLTGRIMVDGELVGAWGRAGADVTLAPWSPLTASAEAGLQAEAEALAGPLGRAPRIRRLR